MSFEQDRSWVRGEAVANDTTTGAPGKRGHTDRLSVPAHKATSATGSAHASSLAGTGWLSGVLGFSSGESEKDDKDKDKSKDKDKDKKKPGAEAEADEEAGEQDGGEETGWSLGLQSIGVTDGEGSDDGDSGGSSSGESDESSGESEGPEGAGGASSGESEGPRGAGAQGAGGASSGDTSGAGGPKPPKLKIEHFTQKLAPGNSDDTRRKVAVGEVVDFTSTVAGDWLATIGTATGALGTSFTWTAPATPGTAVIKCIVGNKSVQKTFTVIKPSSLKFKKTTDHSFPAGTQGATMECDLTVGPSSVCFGNVEWLEIPGPATNVWGYFKGNFDLQHHPNDQWLQWSDNNDGLMDTAGFSGYPKPWKAGGFTWVIPNHYRVVGSNFSNHFATTYQVFSMTKNGTSKVTKGGQATTPRKP